MTGPVTLPLCSLSAIVAVHPALPALASGRVSSAHAAPYVRPTDGLWELYSNHAWTADSGKTKEAVKTGAATDVKGGDTEWYVWSRCQNTLQTVSFSRTVTLPGPPARLSFDVFSRVRTKPATEGSAVLTVNGRAIYHTPVYAFSPTDVSLDSASQHSAFHHGTNRIELSVTKNAGVTCRSGSGHVPFGVAWKLEATSAADVGITKASKTLYAKTSSVVTTYASIPITNLGPDEFLGSQFSISLDYANNLSNNGMVLVHSITPHAPYTNCQGYVDADKRGPAPNLLQYGAVDCVASRIPPHEKTNVDLVLRASWENGVDTNYHNWGEFQVRFDVRATGGMYDPNTQNDMTTLHVVLCGAGNNNPNCSKAT